MNSRRGGDRRISIEVENRADSARRRDFGRFERTRRGSQRVIVLEPVSFDNERIMDVTIFDIPMTIDERYLDADPATVRRQVAEYEHGERETFDIGFSYPVGFTGDVMRVMSEVPRGRTRTYGEVAAELESAAVAVGQACGRNPVPLVVPCHRIVGADSIGGFSSGGEQNTSLKRHLLELEGAIAPRPEQTTLELG